MSTLTLGVVTPYQIPWPTHGIDFRSVMAILRAGNIMNFTMCALNSAPKSRFTGILLVLISHFMLNFWDPKLTDQSLILNTAMHPELYISTVDPYYGSTVFESETRNEDDSGQMPDNSDAVAVDTPSRACPEYAQTNDYCFNGKQTWAAWGSQLFSLTSKSQHLSTEKITPESWGPQMMYQLFWWLQGGDTLQALSMTSFDSCLGNGGGNCVDILQDLWKILKAATQKIQLLKRNQFDASPPTKSDINWTENITMYLGEVLALKNEDGRRSQAPIHESKDVEIW
ncbi:hypothetical protein C8R44DRAFT_729359 [Mycena epipterygia]|nr:hypothetical protein C8R44DRAFT_729359 [Mycena epipterygia]